VLKAQLDNMTTLQGLPKTKIDTAQIVAKLNQAGQANAQAQKLFAAKQELGAKAAAIGVQKIEHGRRIEQQKTAIELLKQELAKAEATLGGLEKEAKFLESDHKKAEEAFRAAPAGELVDVAALTAELQAAERTNQAIDTRARYDQLLAEREAKQRKADTLTRQMEARAEKKRNALAKAKIPVEGLTFDEREVKYNGIPIELLGEGEQIRISTLIGMASNPKLRILCIRHGEALDTQGLKAMAELAKEHNFQIWMARVDDSGKFGIVIEDGSVAARNEA
jgi:hypothetical protein